MTVAIFLISNRQVNAYITAKADLIGYTISLEVLTLTRCVNCRFALHHNDHTTQIRSARWRRGMELMQNVRYGSIVWSMGEVGASMDVIEVNQSRGANLALIRNCECHKSSAWIVWQRSTVSRLVERMLPKQHVMLISLILQFLPILLCQLKQLINVINRSIVFAKWRQSAVNLIQSSFGQHESTAQTASRSVQPCCVARCAQQTYTMSPYHGKRDLLINSRTYIHYSLQ